MDEKIISELFKSLVKYDHETGHFYRIIALKGGKVGKINTCISGNGYFYISVNGKRYLAHRLAWLYFYGCWPEYEIDHINGCRTDNRICNLRDVPSYINNQNRHKVRVDNKASKATGVSWHEHSRKWRARIGLHGKEMRLGLFDTIEEASIAYITAKRNIHEGCTK